MSWDRIGALLDAAVVLATVLAHEAARLLSTLEAPPLDLLVAACVALLVLTGGAWAVRRSRRGGGTGRAQLARSLSAQGVVTAEIARRTGLSRDAVAMLLADRAPAAAGRRNLPEPARSSASPRLRRGFRWGAASPQVVAAK